MSTTAINNESFRLTRRTPRNNADRFGDVLEAVVVDDAPDAHVNPTASSAHNNDRECGQDAHRATAQPG